MYAPARVAAGFLIGIPIGAFTFAAASLVFVGLGLYSANSLLAGAVMGAVVGPLFGAAFALGRPGLRNAALIQMGFCCLLMLAFQFVLLGIGGIYSSFGSALESILTGLAFVGVASALCAAAIVVVNERLLAWMSERASTSAKPSTPSSERRFRL